MQVIIEVYETKELCERGISEKLNSWKVIGFSYGSDCLYRVVYQEVK